MDKIIFYGDSNTFGFDPRFNTDGRYPLENIWPSILAEKFSTRLEIVADGVNGRCIPNLKYEQRYLDRLIEEHEPFELFAVMLGTNDIFGGSEKDVSPIIERMEQFIAYLKSKQEQHMFDILLIAPVWVGSAVSTHPENLRIREKNRLLNESYRKLADKCSIRFVDAQKFGVELTRDYVHFTEDGHREFAESMEAVLDEWRR